MSTMCLIRVTAVAAGTLLLPGCARSPQAVASPDSGGSAPVVVGEPTPSPPDTTDGFTITATEDYGVNGGTMFRYAVGNHAIDVFVYPIPYADAACVADCQRTAIDAEADGFLNQFSGMIDRGYLAKITLTDDTTVDLPGATANRARYIQSHVEDASGRDGISYYVLTSIQTYYVKFRLTDFHSWADGTQILSFVRELTSAIRPMYVCKFGPAQIDPISVSVTLTEDTTTVTRAVSGSLSSLGYSTAFELSGWRTTQPRFTSTPIFEDEAAFANPHPGLQLTITTQAEADSTQLYVVGRALCNLGPAGAREGTRSETMVQLSAALETMNEIRKRLKEEPD